MFDRRGFLEFGIKGSAAACVLGGWGAALAEAGSGMNYGVQMYMVRKQAEHDLAGAFAGIKAAGFDQVELYPIAYHQPAAQLRKLVDDAGLTAVSGHFDYKAREMSVEYAHALGLKYVVCPMVPNALWSSLSGFREAAEYFSKWGEETKKAGMQFAFHNHDYEFKPVEGSDGFSELMKGTDAHLVKLEFDLFWLAQAGQDSAAMLRKYADRAVLVHLKDRDAGAPTSFTPDAGATSHQADLGKGNIDWPALLKQARAQGIRYAYLDMDEVKTTVAESMKDSREYLKTIKT